MNRTVKLIFFFAIFQLPVLLLFLDIIDYSRRYLMLAIGSGLLILYSIKSKHSLSELGFRNGDIRKDIILNSVFCILLVMCLMVVYKLGWIREPTIPDWNYFFVFYVFLSGPLQEFLFRSLTFCELKSAGAGESMKVVVSTVNFGLIHIIYHDWITFLAAMFIGFSLGLIYSQTKSIYGISISHAIVGAVSIYVGLV